jgi:hypothetical protein
MSWADELLKDKNHSDEKIILENPSIIDELDNLLTDRFYPEIYQMLQKTSFPFHPEESDSLKISSYNRQNEVARKFHFGLDDPLHYPILQSEIAVSRKGYYVNRKFNLGLPRNIPPDFLFRILSDKRFVGMPPSLHVEESILRPDWNVYFCITFEAGNGFWGKDFSFFNSAFSIIEDTIGNAVEMYENSMVEGFNSIDDVDRFLYIAAKTFEAC